MKATVSLAANIKTPARAKDIAQRRKQSLADATAIMAAAAAAAASLGSLSESLAAAGHGCIHYALPVSIAWVAINAPALH
jgi:hypothetical protein